MPKRLVLCCDGTWNTPDQLAPTNVTKVALAVADRDAKGIEQRVFYSLGVGTGRGERITGGAFGYGLSHNVIEAYRFVVENYAPGDELFLFGFSRGAFTARSTAGFVRNAGILRPQHTNRIDDAYALYRDRTSKTHPRSTESTLFRRSYSYESRIRFIGVWDTVGALGIPVSGFGLAKLVNARWAFHDTALSSYVDAAFQALAIDEKRGPFQPTLWAKQPDPPKDQRVEQVWFSGVHSDIGGGYPEHGLSDIALLWMVGRARGYGLAFDPTAFDQRPPGAGPASEDETLATRTQVYPDAFGEMHETRTGVYRVLRPYLRQPGSTDPDNEYVASSAVTRSRTLAPYATATLGFVDGHPRTMPVRYLQR